MPRKKKPLPPDPSSLTARIEQSSRNYYPAEYPSIRVGDEAIIEVVGRIEEISRTLKRHRGERLEMAFACSRSFSRDDPTLLTDKPFLLMVTFKSNNRSLMAYLPADAFWAVSR